MTRPMLMAAATRRIRSAQQMLITGSDRLHGTLQPPGGGWLTMLPPDGALITLTRPGQVSVSIELWNSRPPVPVGHDTFTTIQLVLPSGRIDVGDPEATDKMNEEVLQVPPGRYTVTLTGWQRGAHDENYTMQLWADDDAPHFAGHPVGATSWLTGADHYLFTVADDEYADDLETLPAEGGWLGVNPHALVISVISELPAKRVRLELWDAPPPEPAPGNEVQDTCTLTLVSGKIGIGTPAGHHAGIFQIPPRRYQVRLNAWDRTATAREYRDVGERTGFDDTNPEFAGALKRLSGKERYLAQLWPTE